MNAISSPVCAPAGFVEQATEEATFVVDVAATQGSISLSWNAVAGALCYRVYCGLDTDSLGLVEDGLMQTAAVVSGLQTGQAYAVQVTAVLGPLASLASVSDDGAGGLVATQELRVVVTACTPLASDVCYRLIQANTAPLTGGSASPGGGGPQPYAFDYAIDWSDDSSCGYDVQVYPNFAVLASITHKNLPRTRRKQRRVRFTMLDDNQGSFVVTSSPAASGDPMPSGQYRSDTVIVIDFSCDCAGNLSATVSYPDASCTQIRDGYYDKNFVDLGSQLDFPVDWSDTANLGHTAQSRYDANGVFGAGANLLTTTTTIPGGTPEFRTNIRFSNIPPAGTSCRVVQIGYPPTSQAATITCDPSPQSGNPVASYPYGNRYQGASIVFEAVDGMLMVESVQYFGQT